MLTGDENIVDVELIVQYRIRDLENYLFQVNDQRKAIKDVTEAALRQVVGQRTIDEALTEGKLEIQEEILKQVQEVPGPLPNRRARRSSQATNRICTPGSRSRI